MHRSPEDGLSNGTDIVALDAGVATMIFLLLSAACRFANASQQWFYAFRGFT